MADKRFLDAIHDALHEEMARDPATVILGEDVGRKGGVFGVTDGLYEAFGEARVIDTPLAESLIIGVAIGMSVNGLRPIAEIQFADFIHPAFDQILSEAARLRYHSRNGFECPMVIRTPYGGGVHGALYHSQSIEAFYAHIPGLKVVVPSTPADAKGLLRSAVRDHDPVLYLEHKKMYRSVRGEVPDGDFTVPIGPSAVRRPGRDRGRSRGRAHAPAAGHEDDSRERCAHQPRADRPRGQPVWRLRGGDRGHDRRGRVQVPGCPADPAGRSGGPRRSLLCADRRVVYDHRRQDRRGRAHPGSLLARAGRDRTRSVRDREGATMATNIKMPQLGESVHEGTIGKWLKRPGESVAKYEPLVEVITDKVNVEMPSPFAGVLKEILVKEGETVVVGTAIAVIEEAAGAPVAARPSAAAPPAASAPASAARPGSAAAAGAARAPAAVGDGGRTRLAGAAPARDRAVRLTPLVRRMAEEHQIPAQELESIPGTGDGGRITKDDVLRYLQARAAPSAGAAAASTRAPARNAQAPAQATRAPAAAGPPPAAGDQLQKLS